jgi:aspartyl-tRNA(Asn)/glutamyl-tRNA(Gln) amidotransferase subunit A
MASIANLEEMLGWSARKQAASVANGEISASELCEAYLQQISKCDSEIGAYASVLAEHARNQAREIDLQRQRGEALGALAGVPYAVKDLFVTKGFETRAGSKILEGWIPPYDGTHAQRMQRAGAVLLGKLAMDEFAMGSSNENTPYRVVHNPWDLQRVPGGSSGGSAAAVAARSASFALGSDTGGSIRQPAAMCGVVGIKPTYGRVSRFGMIAYASSLDQAGPLARDVRDAAIVLRELAGHDPHDATSLRSNVPDYLSACDRPPASFRVGVYRHALDGEGLDPDVKSNYAQVLQQLQALGGKIVEIDLPHFEHAVAAYYVLATAEAASNLARYDGLRYGRRVNGSDLLETFEKTRGEGFGHEVKLRILLGTFVLRADSYEEYYGRAMKVRTLIAQDYARAFQACDVIATPTSPIPAFRIGERVNDPLAMYLADIFTTSVNLAGLPALSVPSGWATSQGAKLPLGLQLIADKEQETALFAIAAAFEASHGGLSFAPTGRKGAQA